MVHPAEDTGLRGHPLWNEAKMLRPEADALFIRDYGGNQLRLVIPDAVVTETEGVVELCEKGCHEVIPYKSK